MKNVWNYLKNAWSNFPKPAKVACYIFVSQLLGQALKDVAKLPEMAAVYLGLLINFLIVLVEYGKTEVEKRLKK
jgi:hypothetical protein